MRGIALSLVALLSGACGSMRHIREYEPRTRSYRPRVETPDKAEAPSAGSIWLNRGAGETLFTDMSAFRVNDIVTVQIEEVANAQRDARTRVDRDGGFQFGADVMGTFAGQDGVDARNLANGRMESGFQGEGATSRRDNVRFTVAATVTQVLPNGNLFVEGHRVVLVNDEEHHFYISGVARPQDIDRTNTISSIRLADAEVEFVGTGLVTEAQEPGWLTRALNMISPF